MKRIIFALILVGALAGTAFASAASLPFGNAGVIQAGASQTLSCQATPVNLGWGLNTAMTTADNGGPNGSVTFVQVSNVDGAACNGKNIYGRVEDGAGALVGWTTIIDPATGAAMTSAASKAIQTGTNSYKLELIRTSGQYGIDATSVGRIVLWIAD